MNAVNSTADVDRLLDWKQQAMVQVVDGNNTILCSSLLSNFSCQVQRSVGDTKNESLTMKIIHSKANEVIYEKVVELPAFSPIVVEETNYDMADTSSNDVLYYDVFIYDEPVKAAATAVTLSTLLYALVPWKHLWYTSASVVAHLSAPPLGTLPALRIQPRYFPSNHSLHNESVSNSDGDDNSNDDYPPRNKTVPRFSFRSMPALPPIRRRPVSSHNLEVMAQQQQQQDGSVTNANGTLGEVVGTVLRPREWRRLGSPVNVFTGEAELSVLAPADTTAADDAAGLLSHSNAHSTSIGIGTSFDSSSPPCHFPVAIQHSPSGPAGEPEVPGDMPACTPIVDKGLEVASGDEDVDVLGQSTSKEDATSQHCNVCDDTGTSGVADSIDNDDDDHVLSLCTHITPGKYDGSASSRGEASTVVEVPIARYGTIRPRRQSAWAMLWMYLQHLHHQSSHGIVVSSAKTSTESPTHTPHIYCLQQKCIHMQRSPAVHMPPTLVTSKWRA